MVLRALVGSLSAAVVMFAWGFIFWAALPSTQAMLRPIPNEEAVVSVLEENLKESGSGTYRFPLPSEEDQRRAPVRAMENAMRRYRIGPVGMLSYRAEGLDPMSPMVFATGFLHYFVSAVLAALLLAAAAPALRSYAARAGFVFLAGVFAAVALEGADPIWFFKPWDYSLYVAVYDMVCWLLAGLVLGIFVKKRPANAL